MATPNSIPTSAQLLVTVDDASMVDKIKSAIKLFNGVRSISVLPPKASELDAARKDVANGDVREWQSVDELFDTIIGK